MLHSPVESSAPPQVSGAEEHTTQRLGPILCWAVVFADVGTSIYYVPSILYGTVGKLAGFFVLLTMVVFILLTLKYTEVTYRFPQGGGVVTVASRAINQWFGALGGMFILVDYFLTAAISCLSGMLYLSLAVPAIGPLSPFLGLSVTLWITLGVLLLPGILNGVGVSASARVSMGGYHCFRERRDDPGYGLSAYLLWAILGLVSLHVERAFSHVGLHTRWFRRIFSGLLRAGKYLAVIGSDEDTSPSGKQDRALSRCPESCPDQSTLDHIFHVATAARSGRPGTLVADHFAARRQMGGPCRQRWR